VNPRATALPIAALALATALAAPASAGDPPPAAVLDALALLDSDAALYVRVDAAGLAALGREANARLSWASSVLRQTEAGRALISLGGPALSPDGWRALGLDPTRPIVASLGALDERALVGAAGLTGTLLTAATPLPRWRPRAARPLPVWRSRLVVPIGDAALARATLFTLPSSLAPLVPVEPAQATALDALVDGAGAEAARHLARAGAVAIAAGPRGGVLVFHVRASWLVVDEIVPIGRPLRWRDDAALVDRLLARRDPAAARRRLASPASRHLASPGVAVVLEPAAAAAAILWNRVLADGPPPRATLEELRTRCSATAAMLARGPLGAIGATVAARSERVSIAATWEVARGPVATTLAATRDGGLPRDADLAGTDASLATYVASWSPLAALPAVGLTVDLPPRLAPCHPDLAPLAAAYAWPHQLGAVLRNLGQAEPADAPAILAGLGPTLAVVHAPVDGPPSDLTHLRASVEVALAPAIATRLAALADGVWGPPAVDGAARRWGSGRLVAFARTAGGAPTGGVAMHAAPALALTRRAAPPPDGTVLEARLSRRAAGWISPLLTVLIGDVAATARWDGAALQLYASASFAP